MILARYKNVPNIKTTGCFGLRPLVAFSSDESHYSIQKAMHWLGLGTDNLITVKTNPNGSMSVDDLVENIKMVIESNRQPFFINATAGSTVLGAFDDLNAVADVCKKYKLWMHVDVNKMNSLFDEFFKTLIDAHFLELSWWEHCLFQKTQTSIGWNKSS